jgi:glycyl-tRNA synthetase beta chain
MSNPLLLEIGFEELPAIPLLKELGNIRQKFTAVLQKYGFETGFDFYYTPRRFAFYLEHFHDCGADEEVEFFGPPTAVAYKEGSPTKAYESFLTKNSLKPDDISIATKDGKECLYAKKLKKGAKIADVLSVAVGEFLSSLTFGKSMLWGDRSEGFIRPVRWLVALHGDQVVPAEIFGVHSGAITYGHRQRSFNGICIDNSKNYFDVTEKSGVQVCADNRRKTVLQGIADIEQRNGVQVQIDVNLLDEVVAITEYPTALFGSFEEEFLQVAPQIIITSMKENQRYFPVFRDGKLTNGFVVVSNALTDDFDKIIQGNERVLRARLSDALFFWKNDLSKRLDPAPLANIVFAHGLGSVYDKCVREADIAVGLGEAWGVKNIEDLKTAMHLSKADLISDAVGEFGELQGVMGRYYAKNDGYSDEIALAIEEHYLPKGEDSALPSSLFCATAAISAKLDSVMTLFSGGMIPSGSKDPFALRRAAFGIVRVVLEFNLPFDIKTVVSKFARLYKPFNASLVEDFLLDRVYQLFSQINPSIVKAVIDSGERDILALAEKIESLDIISRREGFRENFSTFKRVANISKDIDLVSLGAIDAGLFENEHEKALYDKFAHINAQEGSYFDTLGALFELRVWLDAFFDNCMVNAEDERIRANRKNLIGAIYASFKQIADIKEISL